MFVPVVFAWRAPEKTRPRCLGREPVVDAGTDLFQEGRWHFPRRRQHFDVMMQRAGALLRMELVSVEREID